MRKLFLSALLLPALPLAAQVSVSGVGYLHFRYQLDADSSLSPPAHQNNFDVDRSYISVATPTSDEVSARVTVDVDGRDNSSSLLFRLKYAYVRWRPSGAGVSLTAGMLPTPLVGYTERLWDYRMQGQVAMDRSNYLTSSDIGVSADAEWGDGRFQVVGGVFNGEGYENTPGDHRKDVAARASVRLLSSDTTASTAGLRLTGYAHYGRATGGGIRARWLAMLSWQSKRLTLAAEHGWTRDSTAADSPSTHGRVSSLWGVWRPGNSPFAALARIDRVDRDTDIVPVAPDPATDVETTVIVGVSYQVSPRLRLLIDADLVSLNQGSPGNAFDATRRSLFVHTAFLF